MRRLQNRKGPNVARQKDKEACSTTAQEDEWAVKFSTTGSRGTPDSTAGLVPFECLTITAAAGDWQAGRAENPCT